ncbi:MAG: polysaccharide biosynthesis C-terminal domain-containing protein [Oscillospiraceae bacterium]|nr:polysaccharide biosynthesis C-terminal domain-containing protein [Oscillospiraceae bacterium]
MDRYKRLASNTLILALGQFSSRFLVIIMMRFYTEMLSTDGYGTVGLIIDTCVIIMGIVTLSINDSLIRFGLDKKYDKAQVFSIGLITVIIGLAIFAVFTPILNTVETFRGYTVWIYFYVVSGSLKSCCSLFARSAGYVRLFAVDGLFTTVMNITFNLIFMLGLGLGVKGYLLSVIIADALSIVFVFYMAGLKKYLQIFGLSRHLRTSMYRFCIPLIPTNIMWWIILVSAGFFITHFSGIDDTGLYKAAYRFPNIIVILSLIFMQAWNMSAITEKNSATIARFYTNVFNIMQSVIYIMAAGLMLIIRPALAIFSSAEFHEVYRFSSVLIMAVVFNCFSSFAGSVYVASKKSVRSMTTAIIGAAVNIILNLILIPPWGVYGAGFATLASYLVIFAVRAVDTRKIVFMDFKLPKMLVNSLILAGMGAIVMTVPSQSYFLYYVSLSCLFLMAVVINFRSAMGAVSMILKKRG